MSIATVTTPLCCDCAIAAGSDQRVALGMNRKYLLMGYRDDRQSWLEGAGQIRTVISSMPGK